MDRECSPRTEQAERLSPLSNHPYSHSSGPIASPSQCRNSMCRPGLIFVNADDWGRDAVTTDRTLDCVRSGSVSSVSAMVFMEDSERAAALAREHAIESGLHLNLTTPFSAPNCPPAIKDQQGKIADYLGRHRLAQIIFHPGLRSAFAYVVQAQIEEFRRLYGSVPTRIDGHHHMHLSMNVMLQGLLPRDTIVRRNFSFEARERSIWNRYYRRAVDRLLARRHRLTDYFFSLAPLQPEERLRRIFALSRHHIVEVEVHSVNQDEHHFLTGTGIKRVAGEVKIEPPSAISWQRAAAATSRKE